MDMAAGAFNGPILVEMLNYCGHDQPWSLGQQMRDTMRILPGLQKDHPEFFVWHDTFPPRALAHIITAVCSIKFVLALDHNLLHICKR